MALTLTHSNGETTLGDNTLVFALDDTGHEEFSDQQYQVYGLGGCAFLVRDYQKLIEIPFNEMCSKYFPNTCRPFHTTDVCRSITREQIAALNQLFENFMFYRLARIITINAQNESNLDNITVVTGSLINAVRDISQHTDFDRIYILVEDSERARDETMLGLSGRKLNEGEKTFDIELGSVPKKLSMPALELADIIAHTAGAQARHALDGKADFRRDFASIFQKVDHSLVSFLEIKNVTK